MQCRSTLHVFKYTTISEHFIDYINFTILLPTVPLFSLSSLLLLHTRWAKSRYTVYSVCVCVCVCIYIYIYITVYLILAHPVSEGISLNYYFHSSQGVNGDSN